MSRTNRRKNYQPKRLLLEHILIPGTWHSSASWIPKDSKKAKRIVRKYHSDADYHGWGTNYNGPGWFISKYMQKPYRRACNQSLKTLNDLEEVFFISKPKRVYWD